MSMIHYDRAVSWPVYWQPVPKWLPIRFGHIVGHDAETDEYRVKAVDGTYIIPNSELRVVL